MKKILKRHIIIIGACLTMLVACKRDSDYVISTPAPYISNLDIRKLHRGADVTLTKEVMRSATIVKGQVTSDHSGGNLPEGLLFIQNSRKVAATIRSLPRFQPFLYLLSLRILRVYWASFTMPILNQI